MKKFLVWGAIKGFLRAQRRLGKHTYSTDRHALNQFAWKIHLPGTVLCQRHSPGRCSWGEEKKVSWAIHKTSLNYKGFTKLTVGGPWRHPRLWLELSEDPVLPLVAEVLHNPLLFLKGKQCHSLGSIDIVPLPFWGMPSIRQLGDYSVSQCALHEKVAS